MAKAELIYHRKFTRLLRLLGEPRPPVIGYLELLWLRGYQTGNPVVGDALDVEAAAEFGGEPGTFARAAEDAGFIDRNADGTFSIHDLYEHAPDYVKKRMARNGTAPQDAMPSLRKPKAENKKRSAEKSGGKRRETARDGSAAEDSGGKRRTKKREERRENKEESTEVNLSPAPAVERAAAAPPPSEPVASDPAAKTRPTRPLFDAVAEVTASDPRVSASHIGKVESNLKRAEPPYTPEDVREFGRRFWSLCPWAAGERDRPTLGELEKHIGKLRAPPAELNPPAASTARTHAPGGTHARPHSGDTRRGHGPAPGPGRVEAPSGDYARVVRFRADAGLVDPAAGETPHQPGQDPPP